MVWTHCCLGTSAHLASCSSWVGSHHHIPVLSALPAHLADSVCPAGFPFQGILGLRNPSSLDQCLTCSAENPFLQPSPSCRVAACAGFRLPSICWLHIQGKGQQPVSSEPSLSTFNPSHAVATRLPSRGGGSYCTHGVSSVFALMLQSLYFPLLPAQGCSAPPSAAQIHLFQPKNTKALQWKNTRTRPNHEHMCPNLCFSRTE